ncbi:uncharacterized protein UV8b_00314 [Ustilaginoidea virens]|uniref:Uncharacterized protein n=1 Tax=Ustilaginoidea virens TaxID=1159556 RepID=A0A8E5HIR9_USTVR|nr:uncharacterized protein UV8b_00314 [Ustilaginoidea virens]QUC16073.1 hypothetical protein UV8b_00314 [Ustilaginoidea virens]
MGDAQQQNRAQESPSLQAATCSRIRGRWNGPLASPPLVRQHEILCIRCMRCINYLDITYQTSWPMLSHNRYTKLARLEWESAPSPQRHAFAIIR